LALELLHLPHEAAGVVGRKRADPFRTPAGMRYVVLLLLCAVAVIAYVQRSAISVPTKDIQWELGIDTKGMGMVLAAWDWAYAVFQVPAGVVAGPARGQGAPPPL